MAEERSRGSGAQKKLDYDGGTGTLNDKSVQATNEKMGTNLISVAFGRKVNNGGVLHSLESRRIYRGKPHTRRSDASCFEPDTR